MENKQAKVINMTNVEVGKQNLGKAINKILTKTARMLNYGDELLPEDREPGFILDETRN